MIPRSARATRRSTSAPAHRTGLPVLATAGLAILALAAGCRDEIVVRTGTTIFRDGSVERAVRIVGRTADRETPESADWFERRAQLALARPEAWGRVDRRPGRIDVTGFFARAAEVPPTLTYLDAPEGPTGFRIPGRDGDGAVDGATRLDDRQEVRVELETRGVLTRWIYVERHGDPIGPAARAKILDQVAGLLTEVLRQELRATFGDDFDVAPAERLVRGQGVALASALLDAQLAAGGQADPRGGPLLFRDALRRAGVPVADASVEPDRFWKTQGPLLLRWSRDELARRLSTADRRVAPEELAFWPVGDDAEERFALLLSRYCDDEEACGETVYRWMETLGGRYSGGSQSFRFESVVRLPGTLLRTNGTPDADAVRWLYRDSDLGTGGVVLTATSVETRREALVALGITRDLDTGDLLRLEDLLWRRDPEGAMAARLDEAVRDGDLDRILSSDESDRWAGIAAELHELLHATTSAPP